jgi:hypothetical protein
MPPLTKAIFKSKTLQICGTQLSIGCNNSKLIPEKKKKKKKKKKSKIKEAKFGVNITPFTN